jgi:hypothetical protein
VKWGFVGGLKYPHTWFTSSGPAGPTTATFSRRTTSAINEVLAKNDWKSMLNEKCAREAIVFWWTTSTRTRSRAGVVVHAGRSRTGSSCRESFMTMNDTPLYGKYNDPPHPRSPQVAMEGSRSVPARPGRGRWRAGWFWAIPKAIAPEQKKLAKEIWSGWGRARRSSGHLQGDRGHPPIQQGQEALAKEEPLFSRSRRRCFDAPYHVVPAYYFKQWPEVHATFSDIASKARHRESA